MKTILLDRDGVLNPYMPGNYVLSPSQWQWQINAIKALQDLDRHNYQIIIITNQSCINRKIVSYRTVLAIHFLIKSTLAKHGVTNIHFAICHHVSEDLCKCRKPKAENIYRIINAYHLKKEEIIFIGDSPTDLQAGQSAGIKTIALNTGNQKMKEYLINSDQINFDNLELAINFILKK